MAEREQKKKQAPTKSDEVVEEVPAKSESGEKIKAELDDLLANQVSLGMLTDIFAYTLGFPLPVKQRLLADPTLLMQAYLASAQQQAGFGHVSG